MAIEPPDTGRSSRRPPVTLVYGRLLAADWLHDRYVVHLQSIEQVAREAGVSTQTIRRALDRHQIPLRERERTGVPYSLGGVLTEPFLRVAYVEAQRTVRDIAVEVGCSEAAVLARLRRYGIARRGVRPADKLILADVLTEPELRRRRSAGQLPPQIARELGVDPGSVRSYLRRYGLD